jgi:hypothetical protein
MEFSRSVCMQPGRTLLFKAFYRGRASVNLRAIVKRNEFIIGS